MRVQAASRCLGQLLLLLGHVAAITGCQFVTVDKPIGRPTGAKSASGKDLAKLLDGVWAIFDNVKEIDDDIVHLKYHGKGELTYARVTWEEEAFSTVQQTLFLTEVDRALYVHLPIEAPSEEPADNKDDPPAPGKFIFLQAHVEEGKITLLGPRIERWAAAVEKGDLAGTRFGGKDADRQTGKNQNGPQGVYLDAAPEEVAEFLSTHGATELFRQEIPLSLRRIGELNK